ERAHQRQHQYALVDWHDRRGEFLDQPPLVFERALTLGESIRGLLKCVAVPAYDRLALLVQPALDLLDQIHVPIAGLVKAAHQPPDMLAYRINDLHRFIDINVISRT